MDDVLLTPPDAEEVHLLACGVCAAVTAEDGLTPLQQLLIPALFLSMTGHPQSPTGCANTPTRWAWTTT